MNQDKNGYYAIKGYIYQFDKTLIEILDNPNQNIQIETIQDIDCESYCLQIKHKETQTYAPSKIALAVEQLINEYSKNKDKKYCLYCHFKDQSESEFVPTKIELDVILGAKANTFDEEIKTEFLKNFKIEFAPNFDGQFKILLVKIKEKFKLTTDEEAIYHHAILINKTFNTALSKRSRTINFQSLQKLLNDNSEVVLFGSYSKHLKKSSYLKLIKNKHFRSRVNTNNFERLFIIDCDDISLTNIIKLLNAIGRKFHKPDLSPQPYISLRNCHNLNVIKRKLWDKNIYFFDGTNFNHDKFRLHDLIKNSKNNRSIKIVENSILEKLAKKVNFDEVFEFFTNHFEENLKIERQKIYLDKTVDLLTIIS